MEAPRFDRQQLSSVLGNLSREEQSQLEEINEQSIEIIVTDSRKLSSIITSLVKILRIQSNEEVQLYSLGLITSLLSTAPAKVATYFTESKTHEDSTLSQCLLSSSLTVQKSASLALAYIYSVTDGKFDGLIQWICSNFADASNQSSNTRAAISSLAVLLRNPEARLRFGELGGVEKITKLIKMHQSTFPAQVLYELCFSLWTLSFCEELLNDFVQSGTVPVLVEQITGMPREKVARVSLACLRNLADRQWLYVDVVMTEMIASGLQKTINRLQGNQWTDEDIVADISALNSILAANARELSSFERYKSEVHSGKLKWGVCHNEKFWRENARQLEENDFELLKVLIGLLESDDPEVVSIACFDIGEFVRFYPSGKSIIKHVNGKDIVMRLIDSPNPEIQRHALQCMSKIMVNKWEYVK